VKRTGDCCVGHSAARLAGVSRLAQLWHVLGVEVKNVEEVSVLLPMMWGLMCVGFEIHEVAGSGCHLKRVFRDVRVDG